MDFSCVASLIVLYRKGRLYVLLLWMSTVAPPLLANQEGSSIRTRRSYTHLGSTLNY